MAQIMSVSASQNRANQQQMMEFMNAINKQQQISQKRMAAMMAGMSQNTNQALKQIAEQGMVSLSLNPYSRHKSYFWPCQLAHYSHFTEPLKAAANRQDGGGSHGIGFLGKIIGAAGKGFLGTRAKSSKQNSKNPKR